MIPDRSGSASRCAGRGPRGRSSASPDRVGRRARTAAAACALASPALASTRSITSSMHQPLPRVEHLVEQRAAVVEVPVEAALGDAQRAAPAARSGPRRGRRRRARAGPRRSTCRGGVRVGGAIAYLVSALGTPTRMTTVRMRLLGARAHTSRPWRIHELAPDFRLEDVWALPTPGGPDDFPRLRGADDLERPVAAAPRARRARCGPSGGSSASWFGWDDPDAGRRRPGADAARPVAARTCARRAGPEADDAAVRAALPARRRVGGGDRQPDRPRRRARRLGARRGGRLPRRDGGLREAERAVRQAPTWPRSCRSGT